MRKKVWITVLVMVLLLVVGVTVVQAQTNGAIRGTIYNDTNADGACGEGDATISGVPIDFTHSGGYVVTLTSGNDGTFGLVGVSIGTWSVAVKPLEGWRTTSQSPIVVTLTAEVNAVGGVNFCLAQGTATTPPPTTLPESGAVVPPALLLAAVAGVLLLVAGTALIIRERRTTG